jgi:hypothetical protein
MSITTRSLRVDLSSFMTVLYVTKTEYLNDVEFLNHFIFSLKCKLSKISFTITRSSDFKKYILFDLILSIQSDLRLIDMWFFDEMIIEISCFFHTLNFDTTWWIFFVTFLSFSKTMTSFDNFVSFLTLLNWIVSVRVCSEISFSTFAFFEDESSAYFVAILFSLFEIFDFRSGRWFIENFYLFRLRLLLWLTRDIRFQCENILSFHILSINLDVFWVI